MNKFNIIAGGETLDTFEKTGISLNYQILDILDPVKRKTDFSKTISLPGTTFNNKFFKQIFDVNIDNINFNPNVSIPAFITTGDNEIMKGNLQLLDIFKNQGKITYDVKISGNLKNIFDNLGDKTLRNLDLSEYNHIRNNENVLNSWEYKVRSFGEIKNNQNPGTGYVYPYIMKNYNNNFDRIELYNLFPAPYVKTIIDKLFEENGFTYTSNFFTSEYFSKLILPYTKDNIDMSNEELSKRSSLVGMLEDAAITNPISVSQGWKYNPNYNLFLDRDSGIVDDEVSGEIKFKDNSNQFNNSIFTCNEDGKFDIDFKGRLAMRYEYTGNLNREIEHKSGQLTYEYMLYLKRFNGSIMKLDDSSNGGNDGAIDFEPPEGSHTSPWISKNTKKEDFTFELSATNITMGVGDKVYIKVGLNYTDSVKWRHSVNNDNIDIQVMLLKDSSSKFTFFSIKPSSAISLGNEEINMNNILSEKLKQKDFLGDIINMFNLIIMDNPNKAGDLIIEPRDDYFESKKNVVEWEIDEDSDIKITPMSEIDANSYLYTYSKDDDYYNKEYKEKYDEIYGEYRENVVNDFSTKTNKIKLEFAPTPDSDKYINGRVAPFFVEKSGEDFKPKSVKDRILFYGGTISTTDFYLVKNSSQKLSDAIKLDEYPYCGMWDHPTKPLYDLGFGFTKEKYWEGPIAPILNLFNQFHRGTLNNITDQNSRLMEGMFKLTPTQIEQFDFRDIILIDGSYWRVNTIKDYNPVGSESLTKVELYKLLDYNSISPFDITLPTTNNNCPNDLSLYRTDEESYYISKSGGIISKECCVSIGGLYVDGSCHPIIDRKAGPAKGTFSTGTTITISNPPISKPNGPIIDVINSLNAIGSIVKGTGNYTSKGSGKNMIFGNDNSISRNMKNSIILGDNIGASESNSLFIDEMKYNGTGIYGSQSSISFGDGGEIIFEGGELDFSGIPMTGVPGISINWLGDLSSAPISPNLNDAYYNTIDGKSYIYDGTNWDILSQDGIQGNQGIQGIHGNPGPIGNDGPQGPIGPQGNQGIHGNPGPIGNDGPQGSQGTQGNQGIQGNPGPQGNSINWLGDLSSAPISPNLNDAYYNTIDGKSYIYDGTNWDILSQDGIQGNQGIQGIQGNPGPQGNQGIQGNPGPLVPLTDILAIGNRTLGKHIYISTGDRLQFGNINGTGAIQLAFNGSTTGYPTLYIQDKPGTIALTSDTNNQNLNDVLSINNKTLGKHIYISSGDRLQFGNVNGNGGVQFVYNGSTTGYPSLFIQDKPGTIALTSDIPSSLSLSLNDVLSNNENTNGKNIVISSGDRLQFRNINDNGAVQILLNSGTSGYPSQIIQGKSGTIALLSDIAAAGGFVPIISINYSELKTLKNNNNLEVGTTYHIIDRDIWIKALTTSDLSLSGQRKFLIVKDEYYTPHINGNNNFLGIYGQTIDKGSVPNSQAGFGIQYYAIWGGKLWRRNTSGSDVPGSSNSIISGGWIEYPNMNYSEYKIFDIEYNFDDDFIWTQSDDRGNIIKSVDDTTSYIDITDWGNESIYSNENCGIFNNYRGSSKAFIYDNSNGKSIYNNSNNGVININSNSLSIYNNSNNGFISNNSNGKNIQHNSNGGNIRANSNSDDIDGNSNGESIQYNSNYIIRNNSNSRSITNNSNNGLIDGNSNFGYIYYNSNNGDISSNSNNGDIMYNSNNGYIKSNSNRGYININSNTGNINNNQSYSTFDMNIHTNNNNGYISYNRSRFDGVAIQYNNNNGRIGDTSIVDRYGLIESTYEDK